VDHGCLARVQSAFAVGFHIIFPAFSIGLAAYLMLLEGLWLRSRRQVYLAVYQYWLTIFAVVFGIGVVTGRRHVIRVRHQLVRFRAS
jgi:cytochrome d ubiquinol oxidase subunit I